MLAVVAVVLSQVGREAGEFAPALVLLVLGAGAAVSFQSVANARITSATGDPIAATALNVSVGITALSAVLVVVVGTGNLEPLAWPSEPWLYLGGTLGVTVVLTMALATMALGALRATVTVLAAQIIAAFLIDWVVQDTRPTPGVVLGAVLIVAAVVLVGRRPAPVAVPPAGEL